MSLLYLILMWEAEQTNGQGQWPTKYLSLTLFGKDELKRARTKNLQGEFDESGGATSSFQCRVISYRRPAMGTPDPCFEHLYLQYCTPPGLADLLSGAKHT